jgi:hypothetical protein
MQVEGTRGARVGGAVEELIDLSRDREARSEDEEWKRGGAGVPGGERVDGDIVVAERVVQRSRLGCVVREPLVGVARGTRVPPSWPRTCPVGGTGSWAWPHWRRPPHVALRLKLRLQVCDVAPVPGQRLVQRGHLIGGGHR